LDLWFCKVYWCLNAFVAELCGLFEGLKITYNRGFLAVEFHVDLEAVGKSLKGGALGNVDWEVKVCKFLEVDQEAKIGNSYREVNCYIDVLPNVGCDGNNLWQLLELCPAQIS
jgi:hypothetical protein